MGMFRLLQEGDFFQFLLRLAGDIIEFDTFQLPS